MRDELAEALEYVGALLEVDVEAELDAGLELVDELTVEPVEAELTDVVDAEAEPEFDDEADESDPLAELL